MSALGLTEQWARFSSELSYEQLPADVIRLAKYLLLDTIGTALAGGTLGDCAVPIGRFLDNNAGAPEATAIGRPTRVASLSAAFANGALAHSLNYDAMGELGGHIGVAAVPAPLIVAERRGGVSGKELLVGIVVASEFTARLAAALSRAGVDANEKFLEGQLLAYFGATLGATRVLRFDADRTRDALGIALMQAAGTRQVSFEGGAAKAIYGGYPNLGAVMSVQLAELDVDARCAAIEGPAGLYGLFYDGRYDRETLSSRLGEDYLCLGVRFKPWPTSMRLFPFIEGALELRRGQAVTPADILNVKLSVSPEIGAWLEPQNERRRPHNAATAANSVYFGFAKALINGELTLADITPEGLLQPNVLALSERIDYTFDDRLTVEEAVVDIEMLGKGKLHSRLEQQNAGMTYDQLVHKFRDCAQYAALPLSEHSIAALIESIAECDQLDDIDCITELLRGGTPRRSALFAGAS